MRPILDSQELARPPDPDDPQETDLWLGSYHPLTMVPAFLTSGLLTAGIALAAWLNWNDDLGTAALVWHLALAATAAVWLDKLFRFAWRCLSINYRLTTRRLYRDRGFRNPADGVLDLADIIRVDVERDAWSRWIGIGAIVVQGISSTLRLEGVRDPDAPAELIQRHARRLRDRRRADMKSAERR
jgi:hypothetical protein